MRTAEAVYKVEGEYVASSRIDALDLDDALHLAADIARRDRINQRGEVVVNVRWLTGHELQEMAFAGLNRVVIYGKAPHWSIPAHSVALADLLAPGPGRIAGGES